MKIFLFRDSTVDIDLKGIGDGINSAKTSIRCELGKSPFNITGHRITHPETYSRLPKGVLKETEAADLSVCCTSLPYDNNFFFESSGRIVIVSFLLGNT